MDISNSWAIIQTLMQSLQAAMFFPALLIVLAYGYWIPRVTQAVSQTDPPNEPNMLILGLLALFISYTLYAFNFLLVRFLEGYVWKDWKWGPGPQARDHARQAHAHLCEEIARLAQRRTDQEKQLASLLTHYPVDHPRRIDKEPVFRIKLSETISLLSEREAELDLFYPDAKDILPTRLGNIIAAFEEYPRSRYGMESVVLWPRLVPVLQDSKYLEQIIQERGVFNFLVNTGLALIIIGSGMFLNLMYWGRTGWALVTFGVTSLLVVLCYYALVESAQNWGSTFRTAFDLHRHELRRRLGLKPAPTLNGEVELWQKTSAFLTFRPDRPGEYFDGFLTQREWARQNDPQAGDTENRILTP